LIVQIYEIQTPREAAAMAELGVDHIGSVLTAADDWKQPRLWQTIREVAAAGAKSSLIPLFDDMDAISAALDYYQPDMIHFCHTVLDAPEGWEPWCGRLMSMQATVKQRFPGIAVIRSIPVPPPGMGGDFPVLELARHFEPLSDFFLTDTLLLENNAVQHQPENGYVGITGSICDWDIAARLVAQSAIPVIAAGGLSPDNVGDAVKAIGPAGVDSCTLTNARDAFGQPIRFSKDPEKVARFVTEARKAAAQSGL